MPMVAPPMWRESKSAESPGNPGRFIQAQEHQSEFRFWSGARDLNPGPHGPEPWRGRVLRCPTDSRVVLANTKPTRLVSFGDPEDPADSGRL